MIVCLRCGGKRLLAEEEMGICPKCGGFGYIPDPDLVRIAEALEALAALLEQRLPMPVHAGGWQVFRGTEEG